jgi:EmrB/QacA subfamily drug resistance transporter
MQQSLDSSPADINVQKRRAIFAALGLVLLLASLDQTIVSTALPTIVGEIGGLAHLSWIVTAYLLATTIVIPLYGKLGDVFGRRVVLQTAVVIFLAGSALCGFAKTLPELIVFRAIQGLGGGGLIVTAMAVVGDIVPPRDRGRYQGIFGGVFAFSTVLGPVLGGFFVEHLSWRWIFFINVPLGLVALAVINTTFKSRQAPSQVHIDYAGAALLAATLVGLVLLTSLGTTLYREAPASLVTITGLSLIALAGFLRVERTAPDPLLPPELFANRTFTVAVCVGFIVGMSLFGSITLMPIYLQVVKGLDPSAAGLVLTPMMGGVLVSSITSGQIISRIGRYRIFPILGTGVMTVALFFLSRLGEATTAPTASAYMLLLGLGLGMVMQILVMAVQNAVGYEQLGVATSGTTLSRSIGGSIGTAMFGGIFAYVLETSIHSALPGQPPVLPDPAAVAAMAEPLKAQYLALFVGALHPVFQMASALAFVAFLLTFALNEIPLRSSIAPEPVSDAFPMPRDATSLEELQRIVMRMSATENRWRVYERIAHQAGITLPPDQLWLLARVGEAKRSMTAEELSRRLNLPSQLCSDWLRGLAKAGMVHSDAGRYCLSERGEAACQSLIRRRETNLQHMLADWNISEHQDVRGLLASLSKSFASKPPVRPAEPSSSA